MADSPGTLEQIGSLLTSSLRPLLDALRDTESFKGFIYRLGWKASGMPPEYETLGSVIQAAADKFDALGINPSPGDVSDLVTKAVAAFKAVQSINVAPPGVDGGAFLAEINERLFERLLTDVLAAQLPVAYNLLTGLNVVRLSTNPSMPGRPTFVRNVFDWNALADAVTDPGSLPQQVFGWGTATPDTNKIINLLSRLAHALSFPVAIKVADEAVVQGYVGPTTTPLPTTKALDIYFYTIAIAGQDLDAGFTVRPLPGAGSSLPGIAIEPDIPSQFPLKLQLADDIALRLRAGTNAADLYGITIRPGAISIAYPLAPGTPPPDAGIGVGFDFSPASSVLMFGETTGTRLQFQGASADLNVDSRAAGWEVSLDAALKGLSLVLSPGDADSFMRKIVGDNELTINVPLGVQWSNVSGLTFQGSGGFEVGLATHLSLGPIDVSQITVGLAIAPGGPPKKIALDLGAGISGSLGPLDIVIDQIGMSVNLTLVSGNAGPVDLGVGFLPPKGVGLSIDAGVVSGGGYLYCDSSKGQYAGALQLEFLDFLTVTAIGLVETKMPDGSDGFSLLIIVTADFGAGIQLGFGFTLLAVGGLLGVNRGMLFQPIMDGVRTDAIESVMFPQNVIANAPRIISDLQAFFPPQQGTFLIGPMAKLGWGEPTLISLSLGVIVEIPPGDIAILGVLKVVLPDEDLAILVLQVNFAGALELEKQRFYFYADLYDSHLLFITLDGSMGVLFAYGNDADFVLSVGGFHPQFDPPPLPFPAPQRISAYLINESYARIHFDGYFAVTTNTVQFGSHSDYFFGFSALNVQGSSGFDALIQFSPFHFTISVSTSFSVNVFGVGCYGVGIDLTVDGPTPFHASGSASLSFLFFSISIGIDFTWGDAQNTSLPPVAVMPLLEAELAKQSNWRAFLPPGSNLLVSLRQLDPSEANLVLHPVGTLQVSQRLVPLDLTIDKLGSQQPTDANRFALDVTSGGLTKTRELTEPFAPAQFQNFSDADKLSQPAYVPHDSGIELAVAGTTVASGTAITRIVRYDLTIIDTKLRRIFVRYASFVGSLFQHFLGGASVAFSRLSAKQDALTHPYSGSVAVAPESFAVALKANNAAYSAATASFNSQAAANDYLKRAVAADPTLDGTLHVLPQFEVAR
jgi:hypothetical protein